MRKELMKYWLLLCLGLTFVNTNAQIKKGENYKYDSDTIIYGSDSKVFEVENLGENINSSHVESGPRITPDGQTLFFFRIEDPSKPRERNIWYSEYVEADSSWTEAKEMGKPLNSHGPNGIHWISPDGNTMLMHDTYYKNGTLGNGVSLTNKDKKGKWSFPETQHIKGYKNDGVCSFTLNDDQTVMLMCIKQKDTHGEQDLYISFKEKENHWSKPMNMGPNLNTPGVEATAWLNHAEDSLYFSSNGHGNKVGGMDIYLSTRLDTTTWTKWSRPQNLGEPYNTSDDEYYFTIPEEGDYIYMAHHFEGLSDSLPHSDIVRIRLKDETINLVGQFYDKRTKEPILGQITVKKVASREVAINNKKNTLDKGYEAELFGKELYTYDASGISDDYIPVTSNLDLKGYKSKEKTLDIYLQRKGLLLSGHLFSNKTKEKIPGEIVVILKDGKPYKSVTVDQEKGYEVFLENGHEYELKFNSEGYLSKIEKIDLRDLDDYKEEKKDVYLEFIEKGVTFEIKNIFFAFNKADLLPESFEELNNLVTIMNDYPDIKVEIGGHTDSKGRNEYNRALSQRRSQSVVDYLTGKGIPQKQFVAHGYGEEKPVATNVTEEGRAKNRRVEFKVLEVE